MDFRSLSYFVTVAEELNITRAAARLNMSQPPLSSQIHLLEEDFGTQLFVRNRSGLTLTPTGEILYKRARQILELAQSAREEVGNYEIRLSGDLRIGVVEGRAPFLLARYISGFNEEFPLVTYNIRNGSSDDILDLLFHHVIDVALIASPYDHEHLSGIKLVQTPWVAIIPKDHPLAKQEGESIRLKELKGEPLIVPERPSRVEAIRSWFGQKNISPNILCRTSSHIDAVALVEQNVGICIFPQSTYTPNPHTVTKLIIDPPRKVEYVLAYPKNAPLPELAEAFLDYVRDFLDQDLISTPRFQTREKEFSLPENAKLL